MKGRKREKVQLATKFGVQFKDEKIEVPGDPKYVRDSCEASLMRLEMDYIDLYYVHRIDTRVPIEVTVCPSRTLDSSFATLITLFQITRNDIDY